MKPLSELLHGVAIAAPASAGEITITDIASDSRHVQQGSLFIAVPGTVRDGAEFVPDAIANGARAVLVDAQASLGEVPPEVMVLRSPDVRAATASIAAAFFAPAPKHMVAVTGTDGKTSTAEFYRQFCAASGIAAASVGTLGLRCPHDMLNMQFPANNTSPEPILLHRTLHALQAHGVQHVAMEASSHGLHQKRMDGVQFLAAAFTNLSRDHMDYHGTMEAYAAAKMRLFDALLPVGATAVVNADSPYSTTIREIAAARKLSYVDYGKTAMHYRMLHVQPHAGGLSANVEIEGVQHALELPLYGAFQLYNMLAAFGLARCCNVASETLLPQFTKMRGVHGRLERVALHASGAPVFIDYAHTPAALENILTTLRAHTEHKLHVVFGCGGERDKGKRPEMGKAAARLADHVIITDDNPRREDPQTIRHEVSKGAPDATIIGDRREAIHTALQALRAGDVLVVAGKGHEDYQIIGEQKLHFDDAEVIRELVA